MIQGTTKLFGLVGHPVEHSCSPLIHNTLASLMKLDMIYVPLHVYPENVNQVLKGAYALNIQGMNVTVPYKNVILQQLEDVDPFAVQVGAVNTLKKTQTGYKGYNTDTSGLFLSLISRGITLQNKTVVIIGGGGAARATAMLCAKEKAAGITICNRTRNKAEMIKKDILQHYDIPINVVTPDEFILQNAVDLCFQTTSLGMHPKVKESPVQNHTFFSAVKVAVDLIYNPGKTKFLQMAQSNHCTIINGLGMLLYQAVQAFEIWNEVKVPPDVVEQVRELLSERYQWI